VVREKRTDNVKLEQVVSRVAGETRHWLLFLASFLQEAEVRLFAPNPGHMDVPTAGVILYVVELTEGMPHVNLEGNTK
jgi:hypothetical protein